MRYLVNIDNYDEIDMIGYEDDEGVVYLRYMPADKIEDKFDPQEYNFDYYITLGYKEISEEDFFTELL